jgi:hypothetical protein
LADELVSLAPFPPIADWISPAAPSTAPTAAPDRISPTALLAVPSTPLLVELRLAAGRRLDFVDVPFFFAGLPFEVVLVFFFAAIFLPFSVEHNLNEYFQKDLKSVFYVTHKTRNARLIGIY